jgi:hypothetical protein
VHNITLKEVGMVMIAKSVLSLFFSFLYNKVYLQGYTKNKIAIKTF